LVQEKGISYVTKVDSQLSFFQSLNGKYPFAFPMSEIKSRSENQLSSSMLHIIYSYFLPSFIYTSRWHKEWIYSTRSVVYLRSSLFFKTSSQSPLQISFRQAPLLRQASDKMGSVLDQSGKARQLSIKLQQVEFAEELSKQLLGHATSMEKIYSSLIKATKSASLSDAEYTKLFRTIEDKFTWFTQAEAL